MSAGSSSSRAPQDSIGTVDVASAGLNAVHSRSGSKKVDYVLGLYVSEEEALRQVIWNKLLETKMSSSQEAPLLQLTHWAAAWHKRMCTS